MEEHTSAGGNVVAPTSASTPKKITISDPTAPDVSATTAMNPPANPDPPAEVTPQTADVPVEPPPAPENIPHFGSLQPKIDAHPLFSGAKEPPAKRPRKFLKWTFAPLATLLVVAIIVYLLMDSGAIKGANHLPFHLFKQPVATTAPTITPQQNAKTNTTNSQSSTTATADPYAGWKTYTLTAEKLSLKYPSTWTISPLSGSQASNDTFLATAPDDFLVEVATGANQNSPDVNVIEHTETVTFLGQPAYIDFARKTATSAGQIDAIVLSKSTTSDTLSDVFSAKNITAANAKISLAAEFNSGTGSITKTQASILSSKTYQDFKLFVQSFTY